jgi:hypothetical protein
VSMKLKKMPRMSFTKNDNNKKLGPIQRIY